MELLVTFSAIAITCLGMWWAARKGDQMGREIAFYKSLRVDRTADLERRIKELERKAK
ncbi:hypothetical protein D3C76_1784370 [compost metagenome]